MKISFVSKLVARSRKSKQTRFAPEGAVWRHNIFEQGQFSSRFWVTKLILLITARVQPSFLRTWLWVDFLKFFFFFGGGGSVAVHFSKLHFSRRYARYFKCNKIRSTKIWTRGCWVRSANATSMLYRPPIFLSWLFLLWKCSSDRNFITTGQN